MPKRSTALAAQIKLLEAACRADKVARKAAEVPLRAARSVLRDRLRKLRNNLTKAEASRARMMSHIWITSEDSARMTYGQQWTNNAASVARFKSEITSAELDLELFATLHPELT